MLTRRISMPVSALFATIALLAQYGPAARVEPFSELFAQSNVLTFRPRAPHIKLDNQPIEQLVTTMRHRDPLPENTGTLIHHRQYQLQEGIQINANDPVVFIFSRGFEPKPCAARAARLYEERVIPARCPVIGFDYNDSRKHFSFGQEEDIALLKQIYIAVLQRNPSAQIVIIGNCIGAKAALDLATQKPKNLKALILLTPFISARSLFKRIAQSYVLNLPGAAHLAKSVFSGFTAYDPKKDDLHTRLELIDPRIPIFLGQRMYDAVVPDDEVKELAHILKQQGNPIDGLIVYDPSKSHNCLIYNAKMQYRIARFLKKNHLPYNRAAYLSHSKR